MNIESTKEVKLDCMQPVVDVLTITAGREKIFRTVQYLSKFIVPIIHNNSHDPIKNNTVAGFMNNLGLMCSTTRGVK
jgi:hypothetical protein